MLRHRVISSGFKRCLSASAANSVNKNFDLVIVGGGIVGVCSAREIINRHPHLKIAIVEKEKNLAFHQSGHNRLVFYFCSSTRFMCQWHDLDRVYFNSIFSGVIHAGIYYKPGSLKAKLCVEGLHLTYKYCDEKKIPYKKVGKLIVATNAVEEERLKVSDKFKRLFDNILHSSFLIRYYSPNLLTINFPLQQRRVHASKR